MEPEPELEPDTRSAPELLPTRLVVSPPLPLRLPLRLLPRELPPEPLPDPLPLPLLPMLCRSLLSAGSSVVSLSVLRLRFTAGLRRDRVPPRAVRRAADALLDGDTSELEPREPRPPESEFVPMLASPPLLLLSLWLASKALSSLSPNPEFWYRLRFDARSLPSL